MRVRVQAVLVVVLVGLIAGCGGDDDGTPNPATPTSTPREPLLCTDGGVSSPECLSPTPTPVPITPGAVTFVNNCTVELNMYASGPTELSLGTLAADGGQVSVDLSTLTSGGSYVVIPYPALPASECPNCDDWTALDPPPPTPTPAQREGWMWMDHNRIYAAYCNPSLSGRGICALQHNCCGPEMVQDGGFGTRWELSPNAYGGNDFVNLSTNYGTGPHDPPPLCGPGVNPDNCVTSDANIFFNVPIRWITNSACSFTTRAQSVTGLECLVVHCPDAYRYPIDDKQCACSTGSGRGYLVEYCPPGSRMPPPRG